MRHITMFLLVAFSSSCSLESEPGLPVIEFESCETISPKDMFSGCELTLLKEDGNPFYGNISELRVFDNIVLIKDDRNIIYLFDKNGNLISSSNRVYGNGHGEYSIMMGFTYNIFSNMVEILTPQNILFYDNSFQFIKSTKLPTRNARPGMLGFLFGNIYDLSSDIHLLIPTSNSENNKIYFYNSISESLEDAIGFEQDMIAKITMQNNCFSKVGNEIFFYPPLVSNYLYKLEIDSKTITRSIRLDFGKNGLTRSHVENAENEKQFLLSCDYEFPVSMLYSDNYYISLIKKGNTIRDWYTIIFDKTKHVGYKIKMKKDEYLTFPTIVECKNNVLFSYSSGDAVLSLINEMGMPARDDIKADCLYIVKYFLPIDNFK